MLKKLIFVFALLSLMALFAAPAKTFAQPTIPSSDPEQVGTGCFESGSTFLGLPTWYKYVPSYTDTNGECVFGTQNQSRDANNQCTNGRENEQGQCVGLGPSAILPIAMAVLEILLRVAGMVAVGFIVYGGVRYVISNGQPDAITTARKTITNSLVGLVICIVAVQIVSFVGRTIST